MTRLLGIIGQKIEASSDSPDSQQAELNAKLDESLETQAAANQEQADYQETILGVVQGFSKIMEKIGNILEILSPAGLTTIALLLVGLIIAGIAELWKSAKRWLAGQFSRISGAHIDEGIEVNGQKLQGSLITGKFRGSTKYEIVHVIDTPEGPEYVSLDVRTPKVSAIGSRRKEVDEGYVRLAKRISKEYYDEFMEENPSGIKDRGWYLATADNRVDMIKAKENAKSGHILDSETREIGTPGVSTSSSEFEVYGTMENKTPKGIVVHHTASSNMQSAIDELQKNRYGYHYLIDRDGTVHKKAEDYDILAHAGDMEKINNRLGNHNSIGVSLVALNDNDVTEAQVKAAVKLIQLLQLSYNIPTTEVIGHGDGTERRAPTEGSTVVNELKKINKELEIKTSPKSSFTSTTWVDRVMPRWISSPTITSIDPNAELSGKLDAVSGQLSSSIWNNSSPMINAPVINHVTEQQKIEFDPPDPTKIN